MPHKLLIVCLTLAAGVGATVVVVLFGSWIGRGRWDHYSSGGDFVGTSPSVSPDGSRFVFASPYTGHGDIYEFDESESTYRRLTHNPNYEGFPEYSPDGAKIVFVREEDAVCHVWIMNADGTGQTQLTSDAGDDCGPSFSPDGTRIVFARYVAELKFRRGTAASAELFVINVDGTGETGLTQNEQADWEAKFSPDGKRIIYSVWSDDVWVMDSDGTNRQRLARGSSPSHSPDGSEVVFVSGGYGREISVMRSDGSDIKSVYRSAIYKSEPTLTPDGNHIVFLERLTREGGNICRLKLGETKVDRIASTEPDMEPRR